MGAGVRPRSCRTGAGDEAVGVGAELHAELDRACRRRRPRPTALSAGFQMRARARHRDGVDGDAGGRGSRCCRCRRSRGSSECGPVAAARHPAVGPGSRARWRAPGRRRRRSTPRRRATLPPASVAVPADRDRSGAVCTDAPAAGERDRRRRRRDVASTASPASRPACSVSGCAPMSASRLTVRLLHRRGSCSRSSHRAADRGCRRAPTTTAPCRRRTPARRWRGGRASSSASP